MAAITQSQPRAAATVGSRTAARGPASRVRVPLLIGALAAMLLATVLVLYGLSAAAGRTDVLRVTTEIAAGETITADALGTVGVAVDGTSQLVPVTSSADVLGKVAAKALAPGDLVSRTDVVDVPLPLDGEHRVGAVLAPGRYPLDLHRGDVALATATDGEGVTVGVRVLEMRPAREGIELVLAVPADSAAAIAQLSAQSRLAVVGEARP